MKFKATENELYWTEIAGTYHMTNEHILSLTFVSTQSFEFIFQKPRNELFSKQADRSVFKHQPGNSPYNSEMLSPGCDVTLTLFNMTFVAELVNYFTTKEKSFSATPDYFWKIYSRSLLQCVWYLGLI